MKIELNCLEIVLNCIDSENGDNFPFSTGNITDRLTRKPSKVTMEDGQWSEPEQGLKEGEIIWQMAFERGTYYSRKGY